MIYNESSLLFIIIFQFYFHENYERQTSGKQVFQALVQQTVRKWSHKTLTTTHTLLLLLITKWRHERTLHLSSISMTSPETQTKKTATVTSSPPLSPPAAPQNAKPSPSRVTTVIAASESNPNRQSSQISINTTAAKKKMTTIS